MVLDKLDGWVTDLSKNPFVVFCNPVKEFTEQKE